MASPPFNINQTLPGDTDIVSQHPSNARTFRDIVESWLLVNHNVQGRHDKLDLDVQSSLTGIDSVVRVWANSTGYLKKIFGSSGIEEYVGNPPGTVIDFAGAVVPAGYYACDGSLKDRVVDAPLFAAIGTTWGAGDGSTTFALPDFGGRTTVGKESTATRLTTAGSGINGSVLGATGGGESQTITKENLPSYNLDVTIPSGQGSHSHTASTNAYTGQSGTGGGGAPVAYVNGASVTVNAATLPALTGTAATGGSGTSFSKVQPTAVVQKCIKR